MTASWLSQGSEDSRAEPYVSNRPAWAMIDLSAVAANTRTMKNLIGDVCILAAVVKANGYGLGAVPVALAALRGGATWLAVACVDEGIELRLAGITVPILIMGYVPPEEADAVVKYAFRVAVHSRSTIEALESAASRNDMGRASVTVHIKVDTGLGRFGCTPGEVMPLARMLISSKYLRLEGIMTHFAEADVPGSAFTAQQVRLFERVQREGAEVGIDFAVAHAANSAGAISVPGARFDMVRMGIVLSGHPPSDHPGASITLKAALSLTARLARVFAVCRGESVGYGRAWAASTDSLVGLVPVGYADGYFRCLSNRAEVIVGGKRCAVIGRVSMDQIAIDLTGLGGSSVSEGDEVVLIGRQEGEEITADEVARWAGTISYEVLCGLAPRLPRVYLWEGEVVGQHNLLGGAFRLPERRQDGALA